MALLALAASHCLTSVCPHPDDYMVAIIYKRHAVSITAHMPVWKGREWEIMDAEIYTFTFDPLGQYGQTGTFQAALALVLTLRAIKMHNTRLIERLTQVQWDQRTMGALDSWQGSKFGGSASFS